MRAGELYQHKVLSFWVHHPGEKSQLAAQASLMLWNPVVSPPPTRSDAVGWLTDLRDAVEPVFIGIVFLLACTASSASRTASQRFSLLLLGYRGGWR